MECKERITELEATIQKLEAHRASLIAMPESDSDPAIIAAIADTETVLTSLRIQLANVRAECAGGERALPLARSRAAGAARSSLTKAEQAHKKAVLGASKEVRRHARALGKAAGGTAKANAAPKKKDK